MKKIFYILASAIVALGAVACDNQDLDNIAPGVGGDSLSFSAVIDNTKTALSGNATVWVEGDVVVFEGYEEYEFVYDGTANFTCTKDGVTAALGNKDGLTAWYNKAGIDSNKGTAGAQLKAEGCSFKALNPSFKFEVQNAFLKFTTTEKVTLKGAGLFMEKGVAKDEITITGNGKEQYVAINPTTPAKTTLSYSVNDIECKKVELEFVAKNIYNLGTLEFVSNNSEWSLYSDMDGDDTWNETYFVTTRTQNLVVVKNVPCVEYASFLIRKPSTEWADKYGAGDFVSIKANNYTTATKGGKDLHVEAAGTYDIYFNVETSDVYVMAAGKDIATATKQTVEGNKPTAVNVVYLKPNNNWKADNARFAIYTWDGGDQWFDMTLVEGTTDIYTASLPTNVSNIIFCRMTPSNTANGWNQKWNQSSDLKVPTDGTNLYTVKEGTWNTGGGTWSTYNK